jgi:ribonuclease BN (tRNA processing enzyme)
MKTQMTRRALLAGASSLAATSLLLAHKPPESTTRLILLGTAGGPRPQKLRSAPSQVIVVNDAAYVIDCGDGVARQLVLAGVPLPSIRGVFVTHHHSDHNAGYGNLLLLAWAAGLVTRVDTWGPPPLARITELLFDANEYDISTRIADEGRSPIRPLVHPHELTDGGVFTFEDGTKVTAALVHHPPVVPALAYRFDTPRRSIVISGDTTTCASLAQLARGADVLVHEAYFPAAVDRLAARVRSAVDLKRSILSHHTSAADAGRVAQEAGVGTLVLSHLVPSDDAALTDQMWAEAAATHFRGRIVVGRDLLEI